MENNENNDQKVCATCKHFRIVGFNEFRKGVDMCTRNVFNDNGRRICKWEDTK